MQQTPVPNSSVADTVMSVAELTTGEVEAEEVLDTPSHAEPSDPEMVVIIEQIQTAKKYSKHLDQKTNYTNQSLQLSFKARQLALSKFPDFEKLPEDVREAYILTLLPDAQTLLAQEKSKQREERRRVKKLQRNQQEEEAKKRESLEVQLMTQGLLDNHAKWYKQQNVKDKKIFVEPTDENWGDWHKDDHYLHFMCEAELLLRHNAFKQVCELEIQRLQHQVNSLQQKVQSLQERLTTPSSQAPSRSSSVASELSGNIDPFAPLPPSSFNNETEADKELARYTFPNPNNIPHGVLLVSPAAHNEERNQRPTKRAKTPRPSRHAIPTDSGSEDELPPPRTTQSVEVQTTPSYHPDPELHTPTHSPRHSQPQTPKRSEVGKEVLNELHIIKKIINKRQKHGNRVVNLVQHQRNKRK